MPNTVRAAAAAVILALTAACGAERGPTAAHPEEPPTGQTPVPAVSLGSLAVELDATVTGGDSRRVLRGTGTVAAEVFRISRSGSTTVNDSVAAVRLRIPLDEAGAFLLFTIPGRLPADGTYRLLPLDVTQPFRIGEHFTALYEPNNCLFAYAASVFRAEGGTLEVRGAGEGRIEGRFAFPLARSSFGIYIGTCAPSPGAAWPEAPERVRVEGSFRVAPAS